MDGVKKEKEHKNLVSFSDEAWKTQVVPMAKANGLRNGDYVRFIVANAAKGQ